MGDDKGDQFNIAVSNGSAAKNLSGSTITARFIQLESGKKIEDCNTIAFTGTASSNIATVILPEACYIKPCRFVLTIKVTLEGTRHTVYMADGAIARSSTDKLIDPGREIPDLDDLLAQINRMEQSTNAANAAAQAANAAANSVDNKINTRLGKLSFEVDPSDGGLNIIYND